MIDYLQNPLPAPQPDDKEATLTLEDLKVLLPILEMLAQRGRRVQRGRPHADLDEEHTHLLAIPLAQLATENKSAELQM